MNALRSFARRTNTKETIAPIPPPRDFEKEREIDRSGQLSADDRA
jgi:hypothetical protein